MLLDRAADLALLAIQVAENQVDLERIAGPACAAFDSSSIAEIDLVRDEKVQPEHVVRRLARAAPIDPTPSRSLYRSHAFPTARPDEKRHQADEQGSVVGHRGRPLAPLDPRRPRPTVPGRAECVR